jgi:hypothetical protein
MEFQRKYFRDFQNGLYESRQLRPIHCRPLRNCPPMFMHQALIYLWKDLRPLYQHVRHQGHACKDHLSDDRVRVDSSTRIGQAFHDLLWLIRSVCGSWNLTRNLSIWRTLLDETSPSSACNISLHDLCPINEFTGN